MKTKGSILLASFVILMGCNDSNHNTGLKNEISLLGTITDAPMSNAKICLDYNKNMDCDPQEPYAKSDATGHFNIQGVDSEMMSVSPLVAEMNFDTVNEATNQKLTSKFKLSAPAGCTTINFLTTMAQYFVDANLNKDDAFKKTQSRVFTNQEICANYKEKSEDNEFALNIQNENQYLNRLSRHNVNLFSESMNELYRYYDKDYPSYIIMHRMLIAHAIDRLNYSIKDVAIHPDEQQSEPQNVSSEFWLSPEIDDIKSNSAASFVASEQSVDYITLLDAIERTPYANVVEKFIDAGESGMAIHRFTDFFANKQFNLSYSRTQSVNDSGNEVYSGNTQFFNWNPNTGNFEQGQKFEPSDEIIYTHRNEDEFRLYGYSPTKSPSEQNWFPLSSNSFNENSEEIDNQQIRLLYKGSDGTYSETVDDGPSVIIEAKEIDVSNKNISMLTKLQPDLGLWDSIIKDGAKFKANTTALSLTVKVASIPFTYAPQGFSKCNESQKIEKHCFEVPLLVPRDNRNFFPPSLGILPNVTLDYIDAGDSLNSIIQQSADNIPSMPVLFTDPSRFGGRYTGYTSVYLEKNGSARFYTIYSFSLGQSLGINHPFEITKWKKVQLFDNQDAIIIDLPNNLRRFYPSMPPSIAIYEADNKVYFTGVMDLGDTIGDRKVALNDDTTQELIDAIDTGVLYNKFLTGN